MSTATTMEPNGREKRKKKTKLWTCDVCKVAKFSDFEAACRHEEACQSQQQQLEEKKVIVTDEHGSKPPPPRDASIQSPLHQRKSSTVVQSDPENVKEEKPGQFKAEMALTENQVKQCDAVDMNLDDVVVTIEKQAESKQNSVKATSKESKTSSNGTWLTAGSKRIKKANQPIASRKKTKGESTTLTLNNSKEHKHKRGPPAQTMTSHNPFSIAAKATNANVKKKKKTTTENEATNIQAFFAGVPNSEQMLQEHLAAESQMERQRKRNQASANSITAKAAKKQKQGNLLDPIPVDNEESVDFAAKSSRKKAPTKTMRLSSPVSKKKRAPKQCPAPRFPNPTHVLPTLSSASAVARVPTTVHTTRAPVMAADQTVCLEVPLLLPDTNDSLFGSHRVPEPVDYVSQVLTRLIASAKSNTRVRDRKSAECWADAYRISKHDLSKPEEEKENEEFEAPTNTPHVGGSMRNAADELCSFVEEWKQLRKKSNNRMEQKQKKLANKTKKTKKKKRREYNEDDLWSDEEKEGLATLMLLTGPVASGKTSLVHAVTAQCECQLIEVNTTEKRSGAALKQMLEEATQSHSSLDLLKKNKLKNLFGGHLVDSESDDDDDEKSKQAGGDNLAVILIDEVDLLYEDDAGFWSALADLTKRTKCKCPIVLTANSFPSELRNFPHVHVEMNRPSVPECVERMRYILQCEGIHGVDTSSLASCAKLLDSDLRRFCHEVQSVVEKQVPNDETSNTNNLGMIGLPSQAPTSPFSDASLAGLPTIQRIKPSYIVANEHSLIVLQGKGFLSLVSTSSRCKDGPGYHAQVFIQGRPCTRACILDDETAVAVVAPISQRSASSKTGEASSMLFDDDMSESEGNENVEFGSVSLCSMEKRGLLFTTDLSYCVQELGDGTKIASTQLISPLEMRFTTDDCRAKAVTEAESEKIASSMMKEEVDAWITRNPEPVQVSPASEIPDRSVDVDTLESRAKMASDAAVLEHGLRTSMPFLAGTCRGFGFEMTDQSHMHLNDHNKGETYSENRLFDSGWKDNCFFYGSSDAFVRNPATRRERNLLNAVERFERGQKHQTLVWEVERNTQEDSESDDGVVFEQNDEQALLPQRTAPCLDSFPSVLFGRSKTLPAAVCWEREQLMNYQKWSAFMAQVSFFVKSKGNELFARGLHRTMSCSLDGAENFDSRIVLDYLPFIRRMAVYETVADRLYEILGEKEAENQPSLRRQVSTRRRKKEGRAHYFTNKSFLEYFDRRCIGIRGVKEVTSMLTSRALGVEMGFESPRSGELAS